MIEIEWKSSHYHSDGRRRSRPKPSTVHGWLVKWRATFSGNERLRKEGIREMREAKAVREWKKQRKAARLAESRTSKPGRLLYLWPISRGKKKPQARKQPPRAATKRPGHGSSRHPTSSNRSPRASKRSSHRDRNTSVSRKATKDSQRITVRLAEKK